MKLNETFSYPGATVESVYAIITDQSFREEAADADGALERDITVTSNSVGGDTVTILRKMPAAMPDFIKKLTGETVKVKQIEEWSGRCTVPGWLRDPGGNHVALVSAQATERPGFRGQPYRQRFGEYHRSASRDDRYRNP